MMTRHLLPWTAALTLLLGACGGGSSAASDDAGIAPVPRSDDPRVERLREALGTGRSDLAAELLPQVLALDLPVEGRLLAARQAALLGNDTEAVKHIEAARAAGPKDARVYATAAEIAAAAGRLGLAREELETGLGRCGNAPELRRARGVIAISTSGDLGAARRGLAELEAARAADSELPFLNWPQSEACRLVAQAESASDPAGSLKLLERSLELDPGNRYAAESLGELLLAGGDFEGALTILNGLVADGLPIKAKVARYEKTAAMAYLVDQDRETALEHLARAQALGMPADQLGSGASILSDATVDAMSAGQAAWDAGSREEALVQFQLALRYSPDYEPAQGAVGMVHAAGLVEEGAALQQEARHGEAILVFERALEQDPQSLQAHTLLGASCFALGRFTDASKSWSWVVETARQEAIELPEPLHLNLAQALASAGDGKGARAALQAYLDHEPEGDWAAPTRDYLLQLEQ